MFRCLSFVANFSTFNKTHKNTHFTKYFSRHNLKEIMNYREGIIFQNIITSYRQKYTWGVHGVSLQGSGFQGFIDASAEVFANSPCNILSERAILKAKYWQSSGTPAYRSREMRKKLGINASTTPRQVRQYKQGRANERGQVQEEKRRGNSNVYGENKDACNRRHALKNMRIRGLPPRPSTMLKYNITDERRVLRRYVGKEF